jgi:hypothetical protein
VTTDETSYLKLCVVVLVVVVFAATAAAANAKKYLDFVSMLMFCKHTYLLSYNSVVFRHNVEASTWSPRNNSLKQNPQGTEMQCKICIMRRRSVQTDVKTGTNHKQNRHNYIIRRKNLQRMCNCLHWYPIGGTIKYFSIKKKFSRALIACGIFCA